MTLSFTTHIFPFCLERDERVDAYNEKAKTSSLVNHRERLTIMILRLPAMISHLLLIEIIFSYFNLMRWPIKSHITLMRLPPLSVRIVLLLTISEWCAKIILTLKWHGDSCFYYRHDWWRLSLNYERVSMLRFFYHWPIAIASSLQDDYLLGIKMPNDWYCQAFILTSSRHD